MNTKRSGASIAAIVMFAVAVLWLAVYYVAGSGITFMYMLGSWALLLPVLLVVAAIITAIIGRSVARSATQSATAVGTSAGDATRTNGFAIASMVLGLVGITILAIIFGHVSMSQMKRTGERGQGLARTGLILGYMELAVYVFAIVYAVVLNH